MGRIGERRRRRASPAIPTLASRPPKSAVAGNSIFFFFQISILFSLEFGAQVDACLDLVCVVVASELLKLLRLRLNLS